MDGKFVTHPHPLPRFRTWNPGAQPPQRPCTFTVVTGPGLTAGPVRAVGLWVRPAVIARFWSRDITGMMMIAGVSAMLSGYAGLVLSFHSKVPSGPAIILVASALYVVSVLFGSVSGLVRQMFPGRHLEA